MFKKGKKAYSVIKGKCPRCHEGDFFQFSFTFNPKKITQIHSNCSSCDLRYMMEPSFFYGAMYVSYAITVALCVIAFLVTKVLIGMPLLNSFATIFIILVLLGPLNLRLSRILWINMFVKFDSSFKKG
jgi:uncharacterized protein (DUF983 family)